MMRLVGSGIESIGRTRWLGKSLSPCIRLFSSHEESEIYDLKGCLRWVHEDLMKDSIARPLVLQYQRGKGGAHWPKEYLDDGYTKELENAYNYWISYINEPKDGEWGQLQIRDEQICIHGIAGSGKSRFLEELRRLIDEDKNTNILPIPITFNSPCYFDPMDQRLSRHDIFVELFSRIAFSLFGDNHPETFGRIHAKYKWRCDSNIFDDITWNDITSSIIQYKKEEEKTEYGGIVLLIDEILNTNVSKREMDSDMLRTFRSAWDSPNPRKELSFIFTTLNSYSWLQNQNENGRSIKIYYLPHFSDKTIEGLITEHSKQNKEVIYASMLCDFRPRYVQEIIYNYNNNYQQFCDSKTMNEKLLFISDEYWKHIKRQSASLPDRLFYASFINETMRYDREIPLPAAVARQKLLLCDFVAQSLIIPYKKNDDGEYEAESIPKISLLQIYRYLIKIQEDKPQSLESQLLKQLQTCIGTGTAFERFHILFESLRVNAYQHIHGDEHKIQFTEYFRNIHLFDHRKFKNYCVLFKTEKIRLSDYNSLDALFHDLNKNNAADRESKILDHTFTFGDQKRDQMSFDSILVLETNKNKKLWIFLESQIDEERIVEKCRNFEKIITTNESEYEWFKSDDKLLIISAYKKTDVERFKMCEMKEDPAFNRCALFCEEMRVEHDEEERITKQIMTKHFGPTYQNVLSHYFASTNTEQTGFSLEPRSQK